MLQRVPGLGVVKSVVAVAAQAVEDVNRQTGANVDPNADPGDMLQSNTRGLMAAMSTLPELTERKRTIDKHTALLGSIVKVSSPMLVGGSHKNSLLRPCQEALHASSALSWHCHLSAGVLEGHLLKATLPIHWQHPSSRDTIIMSCMCTYSAACLKL